MYALLIADDSNDLAVLTLVLQRAGLAVTSGTKLSQALQQWEERPADLILLALQTDDPLSRVRKVRAETNVPLIMITDPLSESLHYDLLDAGADLVVTRPFSATLLIGQVRALLRRSGSVPRFSLPTLSVPDFTLDPATRRVSVAGQPARRLTHLEFRLLYTLMIHRGQVLSPDMLVEHVWGYSGEGDRDLVRGLISRLRAKVEPDPQSPRFIVNVPGAGYTFGIEEE